MEILNQNELAPLIGGARYSKGHKALLTALRKRYPATEFRLAGILAGRSWAGGIVSAAGERIADSHPDWLAAAFEAAGRSARAVWEEHKDLGHLAAEYQGDLLYIAAPYGEAPDAFFQLEVDVSHEVVHRPLFDASHWGSPNELQDLQDPYLARPEHPAELTPWRYRLEQFADVRRFLRTMVETERANRLASIPEMEKSTVQMVYLGDGPTRQEEVPMLDTLAPDWIDAPRGEIRFLRDWAESSAGGSGARLCEHWSLQLYDYTHDGKRHMGFTPLWAAADGGLKLPKIEARKCATDAFLMERLEQFDRKAGYPMAWFFYLVHGNRLSYQVGDRVAKGIQEGRIALPGHDAKVVMRWHERPYGF